MSKFLLNLPVQISKAFVYSKIQILFGNNSPQLSAHPAFWPSHGPFLFFLSNRPLPLSPLGLGLSAGPAGSRAGGALPDCHLLHRKTPPAALPSPSLRARLTGGPTCHPSPPARPSSAAPPPPPAAPHAAQPYLRCHPSFYHPAIISPSLIPLLNSPPPSMALMPLMPPLLPPATPLRHSPGPYKRAMRPLTLTAPHDELKPPLFVASGAPPLRQW
jgi:neural Wiskott-Aldrich syndrome protein